MADTRLTLLELANTLAITGKTSRVTLSNIGRPKTTLAANPARVTFGQNQQPQITPDPGAAPVSKQSVTQQFFDAPTNLALSITPDGSVLTWTPLAYTPFGTLYLAEHSVDGVTWKTVGTTAGTSIALPGDNPLTPGEFSQYYFRVTAIREVA